MTEARVEQIEPDGLLANGFLTRAREFAADAKRDANSRASRQVLVHNAVMAACDAVLVIFGRRVVGAERGHQLRLQEVERVIGDGHAGLFERLDEVRLGRNRASYAADFVASQDLDDALEAAEELITLVATRVERWLDSGND